VSQTVIGFTYACDRGTTREIATTDRALKEDASKVTNTLIGLLREPSRTLTLRVDL
jgi:hypothetical protein